MKYQVKNHPQLKSKKVSEMHGSGPCPSKEHTLKRNNVVVRGTDYLLELVHFGKDESKATLQKDGKTITYDFPQEFFVYSVMALLNIGIEEFYNYGNFSDSYFSDLFSGKTSLTYKVSDEQGLTERIVRTNVSSPFHNKN